MSAWRHPSRTGIRSPPPIFANACDPFVLAATETRGRPRTSRRAPRSFSTLNSTNASAKSTRASAPPPSARSWKNSAGGATSWRPWRRFCACARRRATRDWFRARSLQTSSKVELAGFATRTSHGGRPQGPGLFPVDFPARQDRARAPRPGHRLHAPGRLDARPCRRRFRVPVGQRSTGSTHLPESRRALGST